MRLFSAVLVSAAASVVLSAEPLPTLVVPQLATAPIIDGRCDGDEWSGATLLTLSAAPLGSTDPSPVPQTTVRLAWRPEALYIFFHCTDSTITATPDREHDGTLYDEDVVEVFIDAVGDGRAYWEVQISPFACTTDGLHLLTSEPTYEADGRFRKDFYQREHFWGIGFELPELRAAARRQNDGWSVELALPAAPLLRRRGTSEFAVGDSLRLNLLRYDWSAPRIVAERPLHQVTWSAVVAGCPHQSPGRMGYLRFVP